MTPPRPRPSVYVIAGVNGAGKSSVAGETLRQVGADYYNPDEAARKFLAANPTLTQTEANSAAWHEGVRLLKRAIGEQLDFAFETTLGANTIPRLLKKAANAGVEIYVWYLGLDGAELHIARVKSRVARGGHDISEADIRRRYEQSRLNLIDLLPVLRALRMFDNSAEADPAGGKTPKPILVLSMERGKILGPRDLTHTPGWAKPIVAAALKLTRKS
ncbi:MAG: zeta toxin family protein [Pyrinomonadaceae bacterium]|nr:zeta toxin family protein [Pyrinomonadaceae bacterium]